MSPSGPIHCHTVGSSVAGQGVPSSKWYPWATGDILLFHGLQGTFAQHLEYLLPSFCTDLSGYMALSLIFSHSILVAVVQQSLSNMLPQWHNQYCSLAQLWLQQVHIGASWIKLFPNLGSFRALLTEATSTVPPCYQNFTTVHMILK